VKVRQALSIALDRSAVINAGEYGEQPAAQSPTGLVLPLQSSQLAPGAAAENYTAPNLTQARSLLESAGFTYSNGHLYEPGGKPFSLTVIAPSAFTDIMADFQVVANQWDALGASVTLDGESVPSWLQQSETGDYQVSFGGGASPETVDPWGSYNELLNSALAGPIGQPSVGDPEHFVSPQADALLAQWANATTDTARQQAEDGIENIMVSQVPAIPLFYNVLFSEWTTTQVTGWPTASDEYEVPSPLGEQAEVVALHLTAS
jgi:peptide/nickel transport system substrate-binding protein